MKFISGDGDEFKGGDPVMVGPMTVGDKDNSYFRKAIVVSSETGDGPVTVKYIPDGTEETLDKDNVNFPWDLNFNFDFDTGQYGG